MERMFGTTAVGRPLSSFSRWTEMLGRHRKASLFERGQTLVALGGLTWDKFKARMQGKSDIEKIEAVNDLWNKRPWKPDRANWGAEDQWATPLEFCLKGGDCEDYAIAKMFSLKDLGVQCPMRIAVGYRKNEGHAVLLAELEGKILVLDNREKRVMEESEYEFTPIYSLDEESAWMHFKGKVKE